jgi:hypothetical protein
MPVYLQWKRSGTFETNTKRLKYFWKFGRVIVDVWLILTSAETGKEMHEQGHT